MKTTVAPAGQKTSRGDWLNTSVNMVSPDYFGTMGMRMVAGRNFTEADAAAKQPGRAVVNQAFVRRFFPQTAPVGRRFGTATESVAPPQWEIIGVVSDAHYRSLREPIPPTFYHLGESGYFVLAVKTSATPETIVQPVRRTLAALDPALPFIEIHTMADEVDATAAPERLTAALASVFGGVAALLAAVGIYGLLAFAVEQRRREIGIRMALGARPADIGGMIGRQSLWMVAAGAALGLAATRFAGPWVRSLLYAVGPSDPLSLLGAVAFLVLVAAVATAIPAARAVRVEPAAALREENGG
jgi:predicted permease